MAKADYFKATCPAPWQILGVKLLPFSFGHYFKLIRLNCSFVSESEQEGTLGDLLLGIAVCSMPTDPDPTQDPFWRWFNSDHPAGFWNMWQWKLANARASILKRPPFSAFEWDFYRWGQTVGAFDIAEKVRLFNDYIAEHTKQPGFVESDRSGSGVSGGHWSQGVVHALVSKCNYSRREVLNLPMNAAFHDFYKLCEVEGGGHLMTPEQEEVLNP